MSSPGSCLCLETWSVRVLSGEFCSHGVSSVWERRWFCNKFYKERSCLTRSILCRFYNDLVMFLLES